MRWMLRSKIHRATVTDANTDYIGSITIDSELMELSGILEGEKVLVAVIDNGNRFETYVIPGPAGKGDICLNGAAARLVRPGMKVIIMGFELADATIKPTIVHVDGKNRPVSKAKAPGKKDRVSLVCYSDGGSRGNPGLSACAVVITENGEIVHQHAQVLGTHTNNYAEYIGLISAIKAAIDLRADEAEFVMDSELVIKQMTGFYAVKSAELAPLHKEARDLISMIPSVKFRNVRRSEEKIPVADALLNEAMDRAGR